MIVLGFIFLFDQLLKLEQINRQLSENIEKYICDKDEKDKKSTDVFQH